MLASSREPRGGANTCGRDQSRPYELILCFGPTGAGARWKRMVVAFRAAVGRDALVPPNPAAVQTPAGGYGIRPYDRRKVRGQTGNPAAARTPTGGPWPSPTNRGGRRTNRETANPRGVANFCRGRCLHRPGNSAVTQTPAGGYGIRPYDRRRACGQTGNRGANGIANLCRGRCLHRPGNPVATQTPAGGINPAPTNKFYVLGQPWRARGENERLPLSGRP